MSFVVFLAAPGMEEMKNTFDNARLTNSLINSSRNLANFERNSSIRMSSRRAKTLESISSLYVEEVCWLIVLQSGSSAQIIGLR